MFTVVLRRPGRGPLELTPFTESVSFSTLAVGGFGACAFAVPLEQVRAKDVPRLSHVILYHGSTLLWEGRVEDGSVDYVASTFRLSCFGFKRLLEDVSLKRIWLLRSLTWEVAKTEGMAGCGAGPTWNPAAMGLSIGRFDAGDLTRTGIKVENNVGVTPNTGDAIWAHYRAPSGITLVRLRCTAGAATVPNGGILLVQDSPDGSTWTSRLCENSGNTARNLALGASATLLAVGAVRGSSGDLAEFEDFRLLCTSLDEDVTGGMYPKKLLQDVIALVPGLAEGIIDDDDSFAIPQLSRSQRDKVLSVVQEISSYYQRRWGVWEDKTFHWREVDLDQPQWVLTLDELSGLEITSSIDNLVKTAYIAYQDVATGLPEEESAVSTDRRNDFVRAGQQKDEVLSAPVGMTAASASRLAGRIADDHGSLPAVRGTCTLPATTLVRNVVGSARPACHIRAGENVVFPELPKDDYLQPGRDGETLFHVTGTETNMERSQTKLELDGYSRSSDILLSRIAAASRVLTG